MEKLVCFFKHAKLMSVERGQERILIYFPPYLLFCEVVKIAGSFHLEFYANGISRTVMVEGQRPHPNASTRIMFHCETAKSFRQVPNNAIVCCNHV